MPQISTMPIVKLVIMGDIPIELQDLAFPNLKTLLMWWVLHPQTFNFGRMPQLQEIGMHWIPPTAHRFTKIEVRDITCLDHLDLSELKDLAVMPPFTRNRAFTTHVLLDQVRVKVYEADGNPQLNFAGLEFFLETSMKVEREVFIHDAQASELLTLFDLIQRGPAFWRSLLPVSADVEARDVIKLVLEQRQDLLTATSRRILRTPGFPRIFDRFLDRLSIHNYQLTCHSGF
jgi:hypothetical protein